VPNKLPSVSRPSTLTPGRATGPEDLEAVAAALLADDTALEDDQPAFIEFRCPYCSKYLRLEMEWAGRKISCLNRECRHIIPVPKPPKRKRQSKWERYG
jgi:hypothetical protein